MAKLSEEHPSSDVHGRPLPTSTTGLALAGTARLHMERAALTAARSVLSLAELSVPVIAALTRANIRLQRNVPYSGSGLRAHRLDVYHPAQAPSGRLLPCVLYVHGGAFETCSKDTHWPLAQVYARAGYVVFNINYRLAPEHRFPAAPQDVAAAYEWVVDNARRFGADPHRLVLAGESAGANLVTSLALMHVMERPEPWARAIFERNHAPIAVIAACGMLAIRRRHPEHGGFARRGSGAGVLEHAARAYLPEAPQWAGEHDFAEPLQVLEREDGFARPLPPFFVPCGEADPLLNDTHRLEHALTRHGVIHETRYYADEIHAFHAMLWRDAARRCWQQTLRFLDRQLQPCLDSPLYFAA